MKLIEHTENMKTKSRELDWQQNHFYRITYEHGKFQLL